MKRKEEVLEFLRTHFDDLHRNFHVKEMALFGSFARGEEKEGSDIDLIVEFEEGTEEIYRIKSEMRAYLQTRLQRPVDLARKKYLKPFAKEAILRDAIYI